VNADTIAILEGNTFVVSDRRGDIEGSPADPHGLFVDDTRFLSRCGAHRRWAAADDSLDQRCRVFRGAVLPGAGVWHRLHRAVLSLMRKRTVARGFVENLVVDNHSSKPLDIEVRIQADADFADLFEVKDALNKKGDHYRRVEPDHLVLGYRRDQSRFLDARA
jgi:hypothetical protein